MADTRRRARDRGKSDRIDAIAVARAALREGLDALPAAQLEGPELDLRLLVDHRERLIRQRVALNNTLQWHLHDLWPELVLPGSSLFYGRWAPRVARRLARAEQTMRVRIARDELRRIRELSQTIKALEREIAALVAQVAPQLLSGDRLRPSPRPSSSARSPAPAASAVTPSSPSGRRRADPGQLGQDQPAPPGPRRQPADQRRDPSRGHHPVALPPRNPGLHRSQAHRGQEHQGGHPLPQTPPRPPRLAACSRRPTPTEEHRHHHQFLDVGAAIGAATGDTRALRSCLGAEQPTSLRLPLEILGNPKAAGHRAAAHPAEARQPLDLFSEASD